MGSSNRNGVTLLLVRMGLAVFVAATLGNALGVWHTAAFATALPDFCLIHRLTGHDCPGCGTGRSLALLAEGRLAAAFHQHPFGPLVVLWSGAWVLLPERLWRRALRGGRIAAEVPEIALVVSLLLWWLFAKVV